MAYFFSPYSHSILFLLIVFLFKYISYPVLSNSAFPYFRYGINFQSSFFFFFFFFFFFLNTNTPYTNKQPLMMAYEGSESAWDNFDKFIYQFQPETKTLIRDIYLCVCVYLRIVRDISNSKQKFVQIFLSFFLFFLFFFFYGYYASLKHLSGLRQEVYQLLNFVVFRF